MDSTKRYYGLLIFIAIVAIALLLCYKILGPAIETNNSLTTTLNNKTEILEKKQQDLKVVQAKIKKIKDSITSSQKKIYSPVESDLGNDTLFFTLYNDVIEMVHSNSVRIKSIDYVYNPKSDAFVEFGKDVYFVCDVKMELVSNYVNLGKLIQDIYQYPYYIKINQIDVKPYSKDKSILITYMDLRLYAHTSPDDMVETGAAIEDAAYKKPE